MTLKERKERTRLESKADRLAVKIVSLVSARLCNGRLMAYDGIEAAREVRQLLIKRFA